MLKVLTLDTRSWCQTLRSIRPTHTVRICHKCSRSTRDRSVRRCGAFDPSIRSYAYWCKTAPTIEGVQVTFDFPVDDDESAGAEDLSCVAVDRHTLSCHGCVSPTTSKQLAHHKPSRSVKLSGLNSSDGSELRKLGGELGEGHGQVCRRRPPPPGHDTACAAQSGIELNRSWDWKSTREKPKRDRVEQIVGFESTREKTHP